MQYFKGDADEIKFYESIKPILTQLSVEKDDFFSGAYSAFSLGDVLWNSGAIPLKNAIKKEVFRESFDAIFNAFVYVGTFESYMTVFKSIFGDDVEVTFGVPAPGKLTIDIVAAGIQLSNFVARRIEDNAYILENVITQDGDQIVFQSIKGFESQYELEKMLFEMVPDGIYTVISLTIGS